MKNLHLRESKILILEQHRLLGDFIEQELRRKGYSVTYERCYEAIKRTFQLGFTEVVISSKDALQDFPYSNQPRVVQFLDQLESINPEEFRLKTIILATDMSEVQQFSKPYEIEEITNAVKRMLHKKHAA